MKSLFAAVLVTVLPVVAFGVTPPLPLEDCGQIWLTPNHEWTLIVRINGSATLKYASASSAKEVPPRTLDFEKVYSALRAPDSEEDHSISVNLIVRETRRSDFPKSAFPMVAELTPEIREIFSAFLHAEAVYELPEVKKFTFEKSK